MVTTANPITSKLTENAVEAITRATVALSRIPMMLSAARIPTPAQDSSTMWLSTPEKTLPMY